MTSFIPTIVVGGGYAGVAASHNLSLAGHEHVVLERGQIGETWRSQRWDSFAFNTNNRVSTFPGQIYVGVNPEGFALRDEFVGQFEQYVTERGLPVQTGVSVTALDTSSHEGIFHIRAEREGVIESLETRNVIVAAGFQNEQIIPSIGASVPPGILQIHTGDYRNPSLLPSGAVLVVGSAQSGCQIAEDLLESGRQVLLSVSAVARVPRRYHGRDIIDWFIDMGFWDTRLQDLEDPNIQFTTQAQVSGLGPLGRTLSLQHLKRKGASLVGRLAGADGMNLHFIDNVAECVQFADERSGFFKRMIDNYIDKEGISALPIEEDPVDLPDDGSAATPTRAQINLHDDGINTIIWCTGFKGAFDWINLPVIQESGRPIHERGVSSIPGVYFLGAPWLHKRKSGVHYGMNEDAEYIVRHIEESKMAY